MIENNFWDSDQVILWKFVITKISSKTSKIKLKDPPTFKVILRMVSDLLMLEYDCDFEMPRVILHFCSSLKKIMGIFDKYIS